MSKLSNEDLKEKYAKRLKGSGLDVYDVDDVNHKPHPYMVGPRHVEHASEHCGGMLGESTLEAIPCAVRGCQLSYHEHTSDKIMVLEFTRKLKTAEVQRILDPICKEVDADGIAGFSFINPNWAKSNRLTSIEE